MIEILNGTHETVNLKEGSKFKLYDNTDFEVYPSHWHPELEVIMPINGPFTAEIYGNTYELTEGNILIINSGVIHKLWAPQPDGERIIFQASINLIQAVSSFRSIMTLVPPALLITIEKDPDMYNHLHDCVMKIYDEYSDETVLSEAMIYSILLDMFVQVGRKYFMVSDETAINSPKKKEYVEKFSEIASYVDQHFAEDISLEDIASKAGFSKFHFTRLFKQFTGHSFYKFVNMKRIENAEKLLIDPDLSITEIATRSGFSSISAFIRMFKQIKNTTPTEFRNMYRY